MHLTDEQMDFITKNNNVTKAEWPKFIIIIATILDLQRILRFSDTDLRRFLNCIVDGINMAHGPEDDSTRT